MVGPDKQKSPFSYSCYVARSREGEQFVPEHVFSYQLSGILTVNTGVKEYVFREGDFRFIKRNQLIKFNKQPAPDGVFEAVSIYFDQELLKQFSLEYGYNTDSGGNGKVDTVTELKKEALYKSFVDSLLPYLQGNQLINQQLQTLKLREALLILLQSQPSLARLLFDFQEPGKIDLEEFMNRNFHFNVQLKRFAYLTGRSLATFKRDFEHIFHISPSKWLLQRRLQEAHYLIREKGKAPGEVYLETGFEDLSHFSFAFKKQYGVPPSQVAG
ncbi:helix-turn-helix domain-containing protein [Pseudobacter ginsenosidimutans]|uniref:AraC-like DNA-binding protein n=1 Tax=Pseudobacter ginsenosidimutans TaxID=661488 RepID=A0A4Q7N0W3_9BACT|nr:AraC family transcriptional regulator [Pseudobacter ginsenosidimutans]QEC42886.1 helix-turn-helix transcriptional regulator [Pseudobacter ginsenosidimutans]RZS74239.1 AraC-like DNA-binding protein [Pseudobacter ginsenosidimutans]